MAETQPSTTTGLPRTWQQVSEANNRRSEVPAGLWLRCPGCARLLYKRTVEQNLQVCPECDYHFRLGADERAAQLCDPGSFEPMWENVGPVDALQFVDIKPYHERLRAEQQKTGHKDAIICGKGFIKGRGVVLACMDSRFMMGSMGCVVGEKLTRAIELATETNLPLIVVSCSGGARMQESALSLMQMAKTSAAIKKFDEAGGLFISVISDPTYGGVSASFAMLGDFVIAEPGAAFGFAGRIVIEQTIRQKLPDNFQTAEFNLKHGQLDRVVHRKDMRAMLIRLLDMHAVRTEGGAAHGR